MVVHGAVIIEQGVTFAIVVVKPEVTQYTVRATRFRQAIRPYFPNMPIILMSQDKEESLITMVVRMWWSFCGRFRWIESLGKPIIFIES